MPTAYSPLLGLALPVTGELAGQWGDTVNNYITTYLDSSVAGTQTISGSQTAVTLSVTNGSTLVQVGSGSTGSAQYSIINCTGNPAGLLTITAPAQSKTYVVVNATSTSQSVKIVGTGPTTGVTLVAGEKAIVAWNGSDFIKVVSSVITNFTGILGTANGGTGLGGGTPFTANGVVYASSTSALTTSANLQFDGTDLGLGVTPSAWDATFRPIQLGAGGAFITGRTGATSQVTVGANAYFDGTDWRYINTATAARYQQSLGVHTWDNAVSGTAGNIITWSERMRLDTSGNLGIGTSSPAVKLHVNYGNTPSGSAETLRLEVTGNSSGGRGPRIDFYGPAGVGTSTKYAAIGGLNGYVSITGPSTELMRLSTSNANVVGVGNAVNNDWITGLNVFQVGAPSALVNSSSQTKLYSNYYFWNGGSNLIVSNGFYGDFTYDYSIGSFIFSSSAASGTAGGAATVTERMRLDSSGNLGLGVTPSAWTSGGRALDVSSAGTFAFTGGLGTIVAYNAFHNGTNWIYKATTAAKAFVQDSANQYWLTAPSGTAGNAISFTQAMTLTAAGNLGIGTTNPTNFGAGYVNAQVTGTSGAGIFRATSTSVDIRFQADELTPAGFINVASNHPLIFNTNATERVRITSGGLVGIGRTAPAQTLDVEGSVRCLNRYYFQRPSDNYSLSVVSRWDGSTGSPLTGTVGINTAIGSEEANSTVFFAPANGRRMSIDFTGKLSVFGPAGTTASTQIFSNNKTTGGFVLAQGYNSGSDNIAWISNESNADLVFRTNATERARITSGGELLLNQTASTYSGNIFSPRGVVEHVINTFNNGDIWTRFLSGAAGSTTIRGLIDTNGTVLQYTVSSDRRLKENIVDAPSSLNLINEIKVRSFNWKENGAFQQYGFIAQELKEVEPLAVSGSEDGDNVMGVDASKLVPHLVKAIQEQQAIITELRQRVAALEAK